MGHQRNFLLQLMDTQTQMHGQKVHTESVCPWNSQLQVGCLPQIPQLSSGNPGEETDTVYKEENRALSVNMHSPCELAEAEALCIGPAWVCTSSCSMYDLGSQPVGYNPCGESNGLVTGFHITYLH